MRSLDVFLLRFSRRSREKKKELKGLRPFDPVFARHRQMKVSLSAVPAGSLRASTAGAQPSFFECPLLGGESALRRNRSLADCKEEKNLPSRLVRQRCRLPGWICPKADSRRGRGWAHV
jgi:hypothetical protein